MNHVMKNADLGSNREPIEPRGKLGRHLRFGWLLLLLAAMAPLGAVAQLAGTGAISGTVTDATGAVVPNAIVTATSVETNVRTVRNSTSSGAYNLTPLAPGTYTVTVTSKGFERFLQENITVNALATVALNVKLTIGAEAQTITVTDEPPVLETSDAALGAVMDNEMYSSLPLLMGAGNNADQRRATDFASLMPGVQNTFAASAGSGTNATDASGGVNGSSPTGGTQEIYIDGINLPSPLGTGDPRSTWTAFGMDSIDQFQAQTTGISSQYAGQGVQNYSIKQGTNKFHGSLYEFHRDRLFDAWYAQNKTPTPVGLPPAGQSCSSATLTADTSWCKLGGVKPNKIQNEYGIVLSGPIFKNKLFLFYNYGQYRYTLGATNSIQTLPTLNMMGYDPSGAALGYADYNGFQQALVAGTTTAAAGIYDPVTQTQAGCSTNCTRTQFANNQIPSNRFSQGAATFNKFLLPLESITSQTSYVNNVATGEPSGLSNWYQAGRLDYALSSSQQISLIISFGRQSTTGTNAGGTLPPPFNTSQEYHPQTNVDVLKDTWTINSHMVNMFSLAYARYVSSSYTPNDIPAYSTSKTGILNMPAGQASYFPQIKWSGTNVPGTWGGYSWNTKANNTYTITDNLQWDLGKHSLTLGGQFVEMQYNLISPLTYSSPMTFTFAGTQTAGYDASHNTLANSGAAYASYMLGAVSSSSATVAPLELNPRWYDPSFWAQDNYRVTSKLTLNLGLRWDIWPSMIENSDHVTWLNPTGVNPVTGNFGTLAAAGGDATDGWHTGRHNPSDLWLKNIAPRLGLAYQLDSKTVIRTSYGLSFARGGWASGNAQAGSFSTVGLVPAASAAPVTGKNQPSFYWDGTACSSTNSKFSASGLAGDGLTSCGWTGSTAAPSSTLPAGIGMAGYGAVETAALGAKNAVTMNYWNKQVGNRSPEYLNWSFGLERQLNKDTSISVSYVGSEGHFIKLAKASGTYGNGQLPESYAALAGYSLSSTGTGPYTPCSGATCYYPLLGQKATLNGVDGLAAARNFGFLPSNPFNAGMASYYASNTVGSYYTSFPQYSAVSDQTGFVGNENYHALQVSVKQRASHGLNWMANYTYSKSIDDLGTFRVYDNPRLDRSISSANQPHSLTVTAVYHLPIGKGHKFGENMVYRQLVSDWSLSGIGTARTGLPIIVTGSGCGSSSILSQCMPSLVTGQTGRQYKWGKSTSGKAVSWDPKSPNFIGSVNYVNPNAFTVTNAGTQATYGQTSGQATYIGGGPSLYVPGSAPRVAPLGMYSQPSYNVDMALKRTFAFYHDWKLAVEGDMSNVANHVSYAPPTCTVQAGTTSNFCTVTAVANSYSPRSAQLTARISW